MTTKSGNSAFQTGVEFAQSDESAIAAFPRNAQRIRINNQSSSWMKMLEERFNQMVSLENGWDGYHGKPVSFTIARFAAEIIERLYSEEVPPPSLVPGGDGTMQIEWHFNGYDIELDIAAPFQVEASRYHLVTDLEEHVMVRSDFTQIAGWIAEMGDTHPAQLDEAM